MLKTRFPIGTVVRYYGERKEMRGLYRVIQIEPSLRILGESVEYPERLVSFDASTIRQEIPEVTKMKEMLQWF